METRPSVCRPTDFTNLWRIHPKPPKPPVFSLNCSGGGAATLVPQTMMPPKPVLLSICFC